MIARLAGTLIEKGIDHVILDVAGVGYLVHVSLHTLAGLPETGLPATLLTYQHVREDTLALFGFATAEEKVAFELCFAVQGVGPKLVMSILSTLDPRQLSDAVQRKDTARLQKIPGVGKKTAERLVLELSDKFDKLSLPAVARATSSGDRQVESVISALTNLGYRREAAERAANDAQRTEPGAAVAELVKKALRALAE